MGINLDIIIGKGIGSLQLSMTKEQVISLLGKANEENTIDGADEKEVFVMYYDDPSLSLFFEDGNILSCIDICDERITLFDKHISDMNISQIKALLRTHGYSDFEEEKEEWGEHRLSIPSAGLDFYFDNDTFSSVSLCL